MERFRNFGNFVSDRVHGVNQGVSDFFEDRFQVLTPALAQIAQALREVDIEFDPTAERPLVTYLTQYAQAATEKLNYELIESFIDFDPAHRRSQDILLLGFMPLFLRLTAQNRFLAIMPDYYNYDALAAEFSTQEQLGFLKGLVANPIAPETQQAKLAFSTAMTLDAIHKARSNGLNTLQVNFLPGISTQQENLDWLLELAAGRLDQKEFFDDFPIKIQAYKWLVESGLADPETRCFPLWDVFSIAEYIGKILGQQRTAWISTAKTTRNVKDEDSTLDYRIKGDQAYAGLPRQSVSDEYEPHPTKLVLNFQQLVEKLKQIAPGIFSNDNDDSTSPLFKGIQSFKGFFFEVLPQLIEISRKDDKSYCKVFPQSGELSINTVKIDALDNQDLGPVIKLEGTTGEYTPRTGKKINITADYYPKYNLLFADHQSARVFYQIFTGSLRNGGGFVSGIDSLFSQTGMKGAAVEFMSEIREGRHQAAFATDVIPYSISDDEHVSIKEIFNNLAKAVVIDPEIERQVRQQHQDRSQLLTGLQDNLTDGTCLTLFEHEFIQGMEKRLREQGVILHDGRSFWTRFHEIAKWDSIITKASAMVEAEQGTPITSTYLPDNYREGYGLATVPYHKRPSQRQVIQARRGIEKLTKQQLWDWFLQDAKRYFITLEDII